MLVATRTSSGMSDALPLQLGEPANRLHAGDVNLFAHHAGELLLAPRRRGESAFPMPEAAIAVRYRQQAYVRDVVEEGDGRIQQAIAAGHLKIGKREQLLAQLAAVLEREAADAADLVDGIAAFDEARGHDGVVLVMRIEIAHDGPEPLHGHIDDRAANDLRHISLRRHA